MWRSPPSANKSNRWKEELGVALLLRTKRSVKAHGRREHAFLSEAREILAHAELSKQIARRAARGETGSLAIGCVGARRRPASCLN